MMDYIKEHYKEIITITIIVGAIVYINIQGNQYPNASNHVNVGTQTDHVAINYVPEPPSIHNVDIAFSYQYLVKRVLEFTKAIEFDREVIDNSPIALRIEYRLLREHIRQLEHEIVRGSENIQMLIDAAN